MDHVACDKGTEKSRLIEAAGPALALAEWMSIHQANHLIRRQDSAHRRYLTAVGALATARRLLGPGSVFAGKEAKSLPPRRGGVIATGIASGDEEGRGVGALVLGFDAPQATVGRREATVRRRGDRGVPSP